MEARVRRHAGEERRFPAAGGGVRVAAELGRGDVPAGAAERPDGGAAAAGGPGRGAGAELRPPGGRRPAGGGAEDAQPQQEEPGGSRKARGEGHDEADDLLHGSCKTPRTSGRGWGSLL